MNKQDVTKFFKGIQAKAIKHSPEILTAIGITGMISTTILAVKATPKALRLIEEKKQQEQKEELTKVEVVKAAWKPYIPATATCVVSAACLIGANTVHSKRNVALATAYQMSTKAFSEYREKVVETMGERKEKTVHDKIAKDKLEQNPVSQSQVIITEKGNTLCYEPISDRYFKSDKGKIERVVNELNHRMICGMEMNVSLNEFYNAVGLKQTDIGNRIGWRVDKGLIDIHYTAELADDDTPCIVLGFLIPPDYDYRDMY